MCNQSHLGFIGLHLGQHDVLGIQVLADLLDVSRKSRGRRSAAELPITLTSRTRSPVANRATVWSAIATATRSNVSDRFIVKGHHCDTNSLTA